MLLSVQAMERYEIILVPLRDTCTSPYEDESEEEEDYEVRPWATLGYHLVRVAPSYGETSVSRNDASSNNQLECSP